MPAIRRRKTYSVRVGNLSIGSKHPVIIQSMTNTPTSNVKATVKQTCDLIKAGAEMVRLTINDEKTAAAIPKIIRAIRKKGHTTPIIGDFHYNGHQILLKHPDVAKLLDKYRINPGNVGKGKGHNENFETIIKIARKNNKPIRIGVNAGSLDFELITKLIAQNRKRKNPKDGKEVFIEALVASALESAKLALNLGLKKNQIVLSIKTSDLQDLIAVNQLLAKKCDFPLHLGLTEAGGDIQGITSSSAALGILLQKGIGDTIRVSLTPQPNGSRTNEVEVCKVLLQSLGIKFFAPSVTSCPGCGRTDSDYFQSLASEITHYIKKKMPVWKTTYPGVEKLRIAVMGCIVNGPGESKHADIGISLPGISEKPIAPVFINGKKVRTLKGKNVKSDFLKILEKYLRENYKK